MSDELTPAARTHTVVVYSDDARLRDAVRMAVGRRPASDLGRVEWVEAVAGADVLTSLDAGGIDLVVLDGEARPTGGLGLAAAPADPGAAQRPGPDPVR